MIHDDNRAMINFALSNVLQPELRFLVDTFRSYSKDSNSLNDFITWIDETKSKLKAN